MNADLLNYNNEGKTFIAANKRNPSKHIPRNASSIITGSNIIDN